MQEPLDDIYLGLGVQPQMSFCPKSVPLPCHHSQGGNGLAAMLQSIALPPQKLSYGIVYWRVHVLRYKPNNGKCKTFPTLNELSHELAVLIQSSKSSLDAFNTILRHRNALYRLDHGVTREHRPSQHRTRHDPGCHRRGGIYRTPNASLHISPHADRWSVFVRTWTNMRCQTRVANVCLMGRKPRNNKRWRG